MEKSDTGEVMLTSLFQSVTVNSTRKRNLWRKGFIQLVLQCRCSSRKKVRAGIWMLVLMQKPGSGSAYWLASPGLLSLLCYRAQDHQPRDDTTPNGLAFPTSALIKKTPHRLTWSLYLWRNFLT